MPTNRNIRNIESRNRVIGNRARGKLEREGGIASEHVVQVTHKYAH